MFTSALDLVLARVYRKWCTSREWRLNHVPPCRHAHWAICRSLSVTVRHFCFHGCFRFQGGFIHTAERASIFLFTSMVLNMLFHIGTRETNNGKKGYMRRVAWGRSPVWLIPLDHLQLLNRHLGQRKTFHLQVEFRRSSREGVGRERNLVTVHFPRLHGHVFVHGPTIGRPSRSN